MKTPFDSVTVDGVTLKVSWPKMIGTYGAGWELGGDYDPETKRIRVVTGQTRRGMRATFVHELLHHCIERSNVKVGKTLEEQILSGIDSFLLAALRENPALVEWLTEEMM